MLDANGVGTPSLTYTGAAFKKTEVVVLTSHTGNSLFVAYPRKIGGFEYWQRWNASDSHFVEMPDPVWFRLTGKGVEATSLPQPTDHQYTGVAVALTTIDGSGFPYVDWKAVYSPQEFLGDRGAAGDVEIGGSAQLVAAVTASGSLVVFQGHTAWVPVTINDGRNTPTSHADPSDEVWDLAMQLSAPDGDARTPKFDAFWGSPCLIQGDYGFDEPSVQLHAGLQPRHYGNLELIVPRKNGGLVHLIKDNGNTNGVKGVDEGWGFAETIGTAPYDQVSCMQTNFGKAKNGQLHLVARTKDQAGFDYYWRDDDLHWHGPEAVGAPAYGSVTHPYGDNIGVLHQPLGTTQPDRPAGRPIGTPQQMFEGLTQANVDFSRPQEIADLKGWLANPEYTPYPAISQVLLTLIGPRHFLKPVQIDILAYDYEPNQKATRPRVVSDVDIEKLKTAVLAASNERYGTHDTDFWALLSP